MSYKKVILIGYSGHGYVVAEVAIENQCEIIGYTDKTELNKNPYKLKYMGFEFASNFEGWKNNSDYIIGVGDNNIRHKIYNHILAKNNNQLTASSTLIIDHIGILTKAYSYANVAYVGGGMGSKGLHNILEAATFGVPVIIGKNYDKFPEAGKLEDLGGLFSIASSADFQTIATKLFEDDHFRDKTGMICGHWINSNTGATHEIVDYLKTIDEKLIIN